MIYHVLPESEPFSESRGGAIARRAANGLGERLEAVVCPSADPSWGVDNRRVIALQHLTGQSNVKSNVTLASAGEP
jgi:hypothetical protein